jgi:hypothetical protein
MVKNTTGGKGHKSQKAENPKAAKNRRFAELWLSDVGNTFPEGTMLGRVIKRLGNGRMEVFAQDSKGKITPELNVPLRGGMTGRSKSSVWVDANKLVLISETGLVGASHEIFAVLEQKHIDAIKKNPIFDPRFFTAPDSTDADEDAGYEFTDGEEELDIENI